jgi:hypothetical protein
MHRRLLSLATVAVAVGAVVVTSGTATAATPSAVATATAGSITAYAVDIGPDNAYVYDEQFAPSGMIDAQTAGPGLILGGSDPVLGYGRTGVFPPTGEAFAVGTYPVGSGATDATVTFDHGIHGCTGASPTGELTVHQVELDPDDTITSFAASVQLTCEDQQPVAVEMRWNTSVPVVRLVAPVNTQSPTSTVTVPVAAETTFGTASLTGIPAAAIVSDGCSGATVAAGSTCTVGVRAMPTDFVPHQGTLTLPDGGSGWKQPVTVVGRETAKGAYTSLTPRRLLDTRSKIGVKTTTPIGAGKYVDLQVTKRGGVPSSGPSAVVLNITAVKPSKQGYLTVYPAGTSRPKASSVNFNAGWVGANLVTVRLGTGGKVRIYNASGSTHVVADVMGYYHGASSTAADGTTYGGFHSIEPLRLLDTRSKDGWNGKPLGGWYSVESAFAFNSPEVNQHIKAFAVNVTVTKPQGGGYLAAWDGDENAEISTSTVNFTKGRTVANMAIVPTRVCTFCDDASARSIGVVNASNGASHVIIDIVGVFFDNAISDGWRFNPLTAPTRIVDTRSGKGLPRNLAAGQASTVVTPAPVADYNTMAVVTNTTAAKPTKNTVLTLWVNDGSKRPAVSNLNPYAGQLVSAMTMTEVWSKNDFRVHNASGTTPLIIDVAGTMQLYPAQSAAAPAAANREAATDRSASTDLDGGQAFTPGHAASRRFPNR